MFQNGTSDDYIDFLNDLLDVVTSQHVSSVDSVAAGGTGYTVGDILTATGGTFTHAATFRVTAVSSGAVTAVKIVNGGAYTTPPGDPVSTTGPGTGCTLNLTFSNTGWTILRETQEAVSATVAAGGTGYSVNDKLTVVGGVGVGTAAVFNVDTLSGSAVATVSLVTAGDYEEVPANPVSTTVAPSGGTGCTLTVTWQDLDDDDKVVILEGSGSGSDEITVGIRTYNTPAENGSDTSRNWNLAGMTGFNSSLDFDSQPGISPGHPFGSAGGSFVTLKPDTGASEDIEWWLSVTSSKIVGVVKLIGTNTYYGSFHLGFLNRYATASEFPYPLYIQGSSARHDAWHQDTAQGRMTGLSECIGLSGGLSNGPGFFLRTDSQWVTVRNSTATDTGSASRSADIDYVIYPCGRPNLTADVDVEDEIVSSQADVDWSNVIPATGIPGNADMELYQLDSNDRMLIPCTVIAANGDAGLFFELWGDLDGVFWVSVAEGGVSEDTITLTDDSRYYIFQCGNRTEEFAYFALKEA